MNSLLRRGKPLPTAPRSDWRPTIDPIDMLWRLLQAPGLWYAAVAAGALLAVSALVFPGAYIPSENAFGWAADIWPNGYRRLVAMALLGSAPWAKVVLAVIAVLSVVRAFDTPRRDVPASVTLDTRTPLYTDSSATAVLARCRLASALIAGRVRAASDPPGVYDVTSSWAAAVSRVGGNLALVALSLLLLAAPKVSAAEVLNLEPGYPMRSAAAGLVIESAEASVPVVALEDGPSVVELVLGRAIRLSDMWFVWHGQGPALSVSPDDAGGSRSLVIPFLPDETSKYIAVPGTGASLRASVGDGYFLVQPLNRQGQPAGEPYQVSETTQVPLSGAVLSLAPSQYAIISIARLPLWLAVLAALAGLMVFLALSRLEGPSLRLAMSEHSGVTAVEVETSSGSLRHRLWLRLLRFLLA